MKDKKLDAFLNIEKIRETGLKAPVPLIMVWAITAALRRRGIIDGAAFLSELDLLQSAPSLPDEIFAAAEQAKMFFDTDLLLSLFPDP